MGPPGAGLDRGSSRHWAPGTSIPLFSPTRRGPLGNSRFSLESRQPAALAARAGVSDPAVVFPGLKAPECAGSMYKDTVYSAFNLLMHYPPPSGAGQHPQPQPPLVSGPSPAGCLRPP